MSLPMRNAGLRRGKVSGWLGFGLLCGLLLLPAGVRAATLDSALASAFGKLNTNLTARGVIVARLPETNEVAVEYDSDPVPGSGSELLVFAEAAPRPQDREESETEAVQEEDSGSPAAPAPPAALVYHGAITVSEAAGHLNLAVVDEGRNLIAEGDLVFLPRPVKLYLTPVRNLTPYPFLTPQATRSISRRLKGLPGWEVYSLPASNQTTVNYLKQQCRNQGRYGLVVMPFVVFQRNRFEVQLRLVSLFSGLSLRPLTEEFKPFVNFTPAPPAGKPLSPRPYPGTTAPSF